MSMAASDNRFDSLAEHARQLQCLHSALLFRIVETFTIGNHSHIEAAMFGFHQRLHH